MLLIINVSFNLPKASNMKRVRNKLWKNVCSLLFNNKEGRKMEGEKVKRIGIFVIMRGILIFEERNVYLIRSHMKYTFDLKIKKERKKTIKRRRNRVLKHVHVSQWIKPFSFLFLCYNFIECILSVHLNELINLGTCIDLLEFTQLVPYWNYVNKKKKIGGFKTGR